MTAVMPTPGAAGKNLAANVERLRAEQHLSHRKLSAALAAAGQRIPPLGVDRIFRCQRRVDVDELVALAGVLKVSPEALLAPPCDPVAAGPPEGHPAIHAVRALAGHVEQLVAGHADGKRVERSIRRLQIEVEELLEGRTP
jgi:hypothetical protein